MGRRRPSNERGRHPTPSSTRTRLPLIIYRPIRRSSNNTGRPRTSPRRPTPRRSSTASPSRRPSIKRRRHPFSTRSLFSNRISLRLFRTRPYRTIARILRTLFKAHFRRRSSINPDLSNKPATAPRKRYRLPHLSSKARRRLSGPTTRGHIQDRTSRPPHLEARSIRRSHSSNALHRSRGSSLISRGPIRAKSDSHRRQLRSGLRLSNMLQ